MYVLPRGVHVAHREGVAAAKGLSTITMNTNAPCRPGSRETPFGQLWSYMAAILAPMAMVYIRRRFRVRHVRTRGTTQTIARALWFVILVLGRDVTSTCHGDDVCFCRAIAGVSVVSPSDGRE